MAIMKKNRKASTRTRKTLPKPTQRKDSISTIKKAFKNTKGSSGSPSRKLRSKAKSFPIVGIGASAGGLEAFTQLLHHLPPDSDMAFVLIPHLDPKHESFLKELLSKATQMPVSEVTNGMPVEPNRVYIIPPNKNMGISERVLILTPRTEEIRGQHMPIDRFFSSLAADQRNSAIGVILSGTASDGSLGLKAIKEEGGITFAQDKKTAKYGGMPHSAIASGVVDFVLPPEKIAKELMRIGRHPYLLDNVSIPHNKSKKIKTDALSSPEEDYFSQVFNLLLSSHGVDFTHYKHTTIKRRIMRRMALHRMENMADYVKYLHENPVEVGSLYQDILIHVTGFFRDLETFEVLKKVIYPAILNQRSPEKSIRVWVPGCSTGEEAYSLAISLLEFLGKKSKNIPIQIFATDISETTLEKARAGKYGESIMQDVSAERLQRFFTKVETGYQISKSVRDICVFAKQDLTRDPPFSSLDLISCRNVLIYMNTNLQKRVMGIFHYALRPSGYLLLGKTENIIGYSEFFAMIDKKHKIYSRKTTATRLNFGFAANGYELKEADMTKKTPEKGFDVEKEANRIVLSRYAPAGVIVNEHMDIIQFRGHTGPYIEPSPGEASLNLSKMAREGLKLDIRTAIHEAKKKDTSIRKEGLHVKYDNQFKDVAVEVIPIKSPPGERYFLILFEESVAPFLPTDKTETKMTGFAKGRVKPGNKLEKNASKIVEVAQELASTKKYLQSVIEDQEATNEELRAANEEILSSNEEFQSINEELETAREELESTNEELTTLNDELQNRNAELGQLNNDMINLLSSVNLPVVMLGEDLHIRRFTPAAVKALNITPADVGRSISDIKLGIIPDPESLILEVIKTLGTKEMEVRDREGHCYSLRIQPYRTMENKIDGAVLVMVDIDALKKTIEQVKESRDYAEAVIETVREPLIILDGELRVKTANRSFYDTFQVKPEETKNRLIYELGNHQWAIPELTKLLNKIIPQKTQFKNFEVEHHFQSVGLKTMLLNARQINQDGDKSKLILLAIEDITERKQAERQIRELNEKILRAHEQERSRVAGEVHDTIGQALVAMKFRVESLLKEMHEKGNKTGISTLDVVSKMIQKVAIETRRIQQNLRPSVLDDLGIVAAIGWFCREFQTTYPGIRIEQQINVQEDEISPSLKIVIFRIIQEALNNIAKHSKADFVNLSLTKNNGMIEVCVRDNGQGFDVNEELSLKKSKGGLGLSSMEQRAKSSGGCFKLESNEGAGTLIRVSWPLQVTTA